MRDAASTGISPIRQARCRAPQGIGGEWRVTGVSLEGPGCLVRQACALASALLAYVRLRVSGGGGRQLSRAPAARPFAGWRSSSPLPSGGAGTTGPGAVRGRTRRPTSPAAVRWTRSAEPGPGLAVAAVSGAGRWPGRSLSGVGGFRCIAGSLVAWPGLAGLPAWYRKLMSSAGLGSWLASLSGAAEVFTTHDRPQDSPQDGPQESALRSGDGCAASAWARADCCQRFRPSAPVGPGRRYPATETRRWRLTCGGRGLADAAGPAYCWGRTGCARCR